MYIVGERDRENTNYTTHGFTLRLKKCKSHPSPFLLDSINPPTHALSLSPKFHIHLVLIAPSISLTLSLSLYNITTMQALQSPSLRPSPLAPLLKQSPNLTTTTTTNAKPPKRLSISASAQTIPTREKDPKKRVVITGMGLVSVFGNDVDTYYDRLLEGESGIGLIDRFDASKFPTRFGGQIRSFDSQGYIDGKNDRRLDDCLRYCIVAGKKALEHADLGGDKRSKVCAY